MNLELDERHYVSAEGSCDRENSHSKIACCLEAQLLLQLELNLHTVCLDLKCIYISIQQLKQVNIHY